MLFRSSNNLAGMVPGVIAVQRSGDPWFNNSDFWIRGISSFTGDVYKRQALHMAEGWYAVTAFCIQQ